MYDYYFTFFIRGFGFLILEKKKTRKIKNKNRERKVTNLFRVNIY